MIILISVLLFVAVALAVYAFLPSSLEFGLRQPKLSVPVQSAEEPLVLKLQEQINSLNVDLEQIEGEHQSLQRELELANKVVVDLKEELSKLREGRSIPVEELERLKRDNQQLKDELLEKNRQVEKELARSLSLNKELEAQAAGYAKEIEQQKAAVKKQEQLQEESSQQEESFKKEHDELNKRLAEGADKLEAVKRENSDLLNKIKMLEIQLGEYNKEIQRQNLIVSEIKNKAESADLVSRKEYEELKKKLETAEEVLRIVHGAEV